jgi:hypothetical protein
MASSHLSKSQFIRGLQCHKSLWLYKHRPELREEPGAAQQALFDAGTEAGVLARQLFPNGKKIEYENSSFGQKISQTRKYIEDGVSAIYEATFSHDGVLVMVDILHRGPKGWEIYEVKSSTGNKDNKYDHDIACQYYVLNGCGIAVSKTCLAHINNKYARQGGLEIKKLFTIVDLTQEVQSLQKSVKSELKKMKAMVKGDMPGKDIGPHCHNPYPCDFSSFCWSHVPEYSVFDIANLKSQKKFALYYGGVTEFKDIPEDFPLSENQLVQVNSELTGNEVIDKKAIREFLSQLTYPLYFLDFETFQQAVPQFDNQRPYEKIPFQYSVHCLERECTEEEIQNHLVHKEFLAQEETDPREELARSLVEAIPKDACVLAYNMGFEKEVLRGLASLFPELAERLMNIHDNIIDLMISFQKKYYYVKEMRGSYSIKSVLPALVPELAYKGMEISNGGEASNVYARLHLIENKKEVEKIRKSLLEYCGLDTFAMVKLVEKLMEVVDPIP